MQITALRWGNLDLNVVTVELKDAQLDASMVRALARQAEAEREKRAKIIATQGELQAAQVLAAKALDSISIDG